MILLINICKEKLGFYEFVKPVGDILIKENRKGFIRHYSCLTKNDLEKASKIIICGTSIFDDKFLEDVGKFKWILDFRKPVLGICGGMQIIGLIFGGKLGRKTEENKNFLKKKTEIGYYNENFDKEFLGLKGKQEVEVYHLHNNYVDFRKLREFEVFSGDKVSQAVRHKKKKIYGVLFHPEVRQKNLILNFCKLN